MTGVERERVDLSTAVGIEQVGHYEVLLAQAAGVAEGEWSLEHGTADRLPDVDHREAPP